jgi:hypothetical protein
MASPPKKVATVSRKGDLLGGVTAGGGFDCRAPPIVLPRRGGVKVFLASPKHTTNNKLTTLFNGTSFRLWELRRGETY